MTQKHRAAIDAMNASAEAKINWGGPAFPVPELRAPNGTVLMAGNDGMTLRDWFAGQTLAGLVGNPGGPYQANSQSGWDIVNCGTDHVATTCYELADAMLAARSNSTGGSDE